MVPEFRGLRRPSLNVLLPEPEEQCSIRSTQCDFPFIGSCRCFIGCARHKEWSIDMSLSWPNMSLDEGDLSRTDQDFVQYARVLLTQLSTCRGRSDSESLKILLRSSEHFDGVYCSRSNAGITTLGRHLSARRLTTWQKLEIACARKAR